MSDSKITPEQQLDPLVIQLQKELSTIIDVKHLNTANILDALVQGMEMVKTIHTKTNEQKKIILLDCFKLMIIHSNDINQSIKDDLIWIIDEMGPTAVELVLYVATKGIDTFKNSTCFKCGCLKC